MKQLMQDLRTGETSHLEGPVPTPGRGAAVIQTAASVISAGTERMLVEFGKAGLVRKARSQPDKVREVIAKVKTDGLASTVEAVRAKLNTPIPLGYCNAGTVVAVGLETPFAVGDRVASNGPHAEYVHVGRNLMARVPEGVSFEAAAFTSLASIGLQGIRLAQPTLGESVVVYGLGMVGLLTVQLLRANGCRVIGIDRDDDRLRLAEQFGAEVIDAKKHEVVRNVSVAVGGNGVDIVLMTLASKDNGPIQEAAEMCRKRGRIVLVGVTGLQLSRDVFYRKELTFTVSCSYGPGRYDPEYEEFGNDYPIGYVRWTEQRNFETCLRLMGEGSLQPELLITHRFAFNDAVDAYDILRREQPTLGIVLTYPSTASPSRKHELTTSIAESRPIQPRVSRNECVAGVIGAGNFASRTLIPALSKAGAVLSAVASRRGTNAALMAKRFGFTHATSEIESVLEDPKINTIFVVTPHSSHAGLVMKGLQAGKHVFVEKPLALLHREVEEIGQIARSTSCMLMVGFNRRFAPMAHAVRAAMEGRAGPASVVMTVNAGWIPNDHWTQSPVEGGRRIVGEACHWIDLSRWLVNERIVGLNVAMARTREGEPIDDVSHISMQFEGGSTAVVHYLASGSKSYPKERLDVFFDGKTAVIDNWRRLKTYGFSTGRRYRARMDKGHQAEMEAWCAAVRVGEASPIPLDEILEVSTWSITAAALAKGETQWSPNPMPPTDSS